MNRHTLPKNLMVTNERTIAKETSRLTIAQISNLQEDARPIFATASWLDKSADATSYEPLTD